LSLTALKTAAFPPRYWEMSCSYFIKSVCTIQYAYECGCRERVGERKVILHLLFLSCCLYLFAWSVSLQIMVLLLL